MAKKSKASEPDSGKKGSKILQEQTKGQNERDPKGRKGQYTGAGDSALTKK
jgi:hypothetical protein